MCNKDIPLDNKTKNGPVKLVGCMNVDKKLPR